MESQSGTLPRDTDRSVSVDTERKLRFQIIRGEIPANSWLRETVIADHLGVSRTPVREACTRLARDGLLEWTPHRGFRLPDLDATALDDAYPVLVALEELALDLLPDNVAQLVAALQDPDLDVASDSMDALDRYEADRLWHARLVAATGNPILAELHDQLSVRVARHVYVYWARRRDVSQSAIEHRQIVSALEQRDVRLASAFLAAHRRRGLERITRLLA